MKNYEKKTPKKKKKTVPPKKCTIHTNSFVEIETLLTCYMLHICVNNLLIETSLIIHELLLFIKK